METASPLLHLPASHLVSGLAADLLEGRCCELLRPLRFLRPGSVLEPHPSPGARVSLAAELAMANQGYGHPRAAELAERFADPNTAIVVSGQQAGLFGGPLYSLTKMIAVARWAERLEAQGVAAVGVFWVATEDHDFAEVARATFAASGAKVLDLGEDLDPLMPVGMRPLGPQLARVMKEIEDLYGTEVSSAGSELLESAYCPEATFGEAFSRFMVGLLGERSPLLLDSMLPALKRAQRPWLRRLVERRAEVSSALSEAAKRVDDSGHRLQVPEQKGASPLFVLSGSARRRVVWEGEEGWSLRGENETREVSSLLGMIEEDPGAVSPGVLARPAIQDAVLGSSLQLMGPGELAYLAQASSLYPILDVGAPFTALRPQMLVLERAPRRQLQKLGLPLTEILGSEAELERRLAEDLGAGAMDTARAAVLAGIEDLRDPCLDIDRDLERPWRKTRDQVARALDLLSAKAYAAAVRRDDTLRQRCESIRAACLPLGRPQERVLCTAHFALRHGPGFALRAWEQLDVSSDAIQIVDPQGVEA